MRVESYFQGKKKGFGRMTTRLLASIVTDYCDSAAGAWWAGSFYAHMANHAFALLNRELAANSVSILLSPQHYTFKGTTYHKIPAVNRVTCKWGL